jgi:hypothetical protein
MTVDLDHCPRCGRRVSDYDERGRENDDGQRECNGQCPGESWAGRLPHTARDADDAYLCPHCGGDHDPRQAPRAARRLTFVDGSSWNAPSVDGGAS